MCDGVRTLKINWVVHLLCQVINQRCSSKSVLVLFASFVGSSGSKLMLEQTTAHIRHLHIREVLQCDKRLVTKDDTTPMR